jgi:hypothetical protein
VSSELEGPEVPTEAGLTEKRDESQRRKQTENKDACQLFKRLSPRCGVTTRQNPARGLCCRRQALGVRSTGHQAEPLPRPHGPVRPNQSEVPIASRRAGKLRKATARWIRRHLRRYLCLCVARWSWTIWIGSTSVPLLPQTSVACTRS